MSPNLFVALKTLGHPETWFREKPASAPISLIQQRSTPIPGIYKHISSGWFLIARESTPGSKVFTNKLDTPLPVIYSQVLKRWLFEDEFVARQRKGRIEGEPKWHKGDGFFRLDDGVSWVHCFDSEEGFIPGPWRRYCFDRETDRFRPMLKGDGKYGDDQRWLVRRETEQKSSRNSSRSAKREAREEMEQKGSRDSSRSAKREAGKEDQVRGRSKASSLNKSERSESPLLSSATSLASRTGADKDEPTKLAMPAMQRLPSQFKLV